MYADVVWGGGSGGPVDDFLTVGWDPNGKGQFFYAGIGQRNVCLTYRKNVALRCGCSIALSDWTRLQWALLAFSALTLLVGL